MTDEFSRTSALIGSLAEQSKDIGKVLDVIRAIAKQSNLLALNAAIEAARASEAGQIGERNLLIASAPEAQAAVVREVDRNIVNISDLSTQSAAGANQTSAAAYELARLATDLNTLVSRFVI